MSKVAPCNNQRQVYLRFLVAPIRILKIFFRNETLEIKKELTLRYENNLYVADRDNIIEYNPPNEYIGTATTYRKLGGIVFKKYE